MRKPKRRRAGPVERILLAARSANPANASFSLWQAWKLYEAISWLQDDKEKEARFNNAITEAKRRGI